MLPFHNFGQGCLIIKMVDSFLPTSRTLQPLDIFSTKFGMVVGNEMLDERDTCFLPRGCP